MTANDYTTRYETILNMNLAKDEREKLMAWLLVDLERALQPSLYESKSSEQEKKDLCGLYSKVLEGLR